MSISGIETVQSVGNTSLPARTDMVDKDDFLTMLVAQLQAQDPLDPMDGTDFTAQLAQFSSLEQLQNVNANLEYLLLFESSINNAQAVSFIGKDVTATGNKTQVREGIVDPMHFELSDDAQALYIHVYDSDGTLIRSVETSGAEAGQQSYTWDGRNDDGDVMPDGIYSFEVIAEDELNENIAVTTYTTGTVSGVELKDNATYIVAGGIEVPIGSIVKITEP